MKLTENDFTLMEPDEYYWSNGNVLAFTDYLPDDDNQGKKIIQQILENQKIASVLVKCYRECRARQECLAISQYETDQQRFMEKLYKRATGKDIHAIQSQPKVSEETK